MRKFILCLGALLVCAFVSFFIGKHIYTKPGTLVSSKNILIPKGNTSTVLTFLQQEKVLPKLFFSDLVFRVAVKVTSQSGPLRAAEFSFPQHASMQQVIDILRHAKPVQHSLTIPEGLTAYQIAELINNDPFLKGHVDVPVEGSVLPQTYAFQLNSSREELLQRMQEAMKKELKRIWDGRQQIEEVKTPEDLVILASIVEKETAVKRERPMVASVFINRLNLGMKLQSDPTIIYALTDGKGNLGRSLTRKDWLVANPYNTYWTDGLPPTPICSPGVAALEAVAHPVDGSMLYFVANGTGGHSFANSLSEHNHNVSLRKELNNQ